MNILDELTNYIATKMSLEPGENLFYNSMPDEPDYSKSHTAQEFLCR